MKNSLDSCIVYAEEKKGVELLERVNLSLKTIYKMLMSNDYPVYSDSVIPEKMRKGQTLLRFWQSMIAEEFCAGPCGRVIWKNDGKRNRYLSGLCNRSVDHRMAREYARELAAQCNPEILLKQISRFSEFLSLREFRYEILLRRILELVRIWESDDRVIPSVVLQRIREYAVPGVVPIDADMQGRLFQSGYLLTMLTLYACSGESMDEPGLAVLLGEKLSLEALWQDRKRTPEPAATVEYITRRSEMIQDHSLPRHRFFGREEALFDIRELVAAQKKCLISGIGGIGKTELLRQLLQLCEEDRLADKIAVVPYGSGLADSFVRAFQERRQMETEEAFRSILAGLNRDIGSGARVLILIDDLNRSLEEDPDLRELEKLSCAVLITSRRTSLVGFETYHLGAPSVTTGTLIFRDNYGHPMTRDDRDTLSQILRNEDICHPLTLNLMARAAGTRGWSVSQLMNHLQSQGINLTWMEGDRIIRTGVIYNQLYSLMQVPDDCRKMAELFTLLPLDSYSEVFLTETFPELMGPSPGEKLMQLADGGWLEILSDGYSMHPLIAECLRRKVITEDRQTMVLEGLRRRLPPLRPVRYELELPSPEITQNARILLYVAKLLSGGISSGLMLDILNALSLQYLPKASQKDYFAQLTQWRRRCRHWTDLIHIAYCAVLANWDMLSAEECEAAYAAQKRQLTVPKSLYLDFCLRAGQCMINSQRQTLAWDMLSEGLCAESTAVQKAAAYYQLSAHCHVLGKPEQATTWCEKGAEYVREHPECGLLGKINILHMLCSLYTQYRKQEKACALIREMAPLFEGTDRPDLKAQYLDIVGLYEMTFGDPDKAIHCMQEAQALYVECFGKDRNYYQQINMMGNTFIRLNRLENAVEAYETSIAFARQTEDHRMLQSASNNISVALLKMRKPHQALVHLETAVAEGRRIGGLMFGESLRNTALAYGQLGDEDEELAYYEEAWPLLLEAYGPDHPRAADTRKRMDELKCKK